MIFKRIISIILIIMLCVGLSACFSNNNTGKGNDSTYTKRYDYVINNGEPVELLIDINNLLPTSNEVATEQQPIVFRSIQTIANNFMIEFPNVKIEWAYSKKSVGDWEQWMTTQISTGNPPDIVFMHGAKYAERNWFVKLNDIFEEPNIFIEEGRGSVKWKDQFPSYMWDSSMTTDAAGNILAVPVTIYPGTATAYFYNKDIFKDLNLEIPTTWEELMQISQTIKDAGYTAIAPWSLNSTVNVDVWDIQYSLGPTFSNKIKDQWDYNGDGNMSQEEKLRAVYEGVFYGKGQNRENIIALYDQVARKYNQILDKGASKTNYEPLWNQGKVAMIEDGMWRISQEEANTERQFEYGIFAQPLADSTTSIYASDFEMGEGAYNPPIAEAFNICRQAVEVKGQGNLEASTRFLQWITMPEHLNAMILEKNGENLGAVYGTTIPNIILPFIRGLFARTPNSTWITGMTVTTQETMSRHLQYYVAGRRSVDEFFEVYDAQLYSGTIALMNSLGIDPKVLGWSDDAYKKLYN